VQKDARADLNVIEKRIRQQETDVERMKDEYHRELLRLRNLIKQKEIIISRLQQEKTYVNNFVCDWCLCPDCMELNLVWREPYNGYTLRDWNCALVANYYITTKGKMS
jgi:hypothetical protein